MTPEHWQKIKRLLDESADLEAEERTAWLDELGRRDPAMRRELAGYLAYEDDLDGFIDSSPAEALIAAIDDHPSFEGKLVGRYRVDRLLGSGGMGAVYSAHRESEFEQRVALKIVPSGFETPEILRRFHDERQILARLEHPNIARLLDGGASSDGHPYFAMELVAGTPIDQYCAEHRLPVTARLELVLQVCEALQFAHRNLVIHRDLKPGNIMVTREGMVKLLDFGIAKLVSEAKAKPTDVKPGHQPMTLHYASPEQLRQEPITTASDVYSLGVTFHKLMTGRLPRGLDAPSRIQVARAVCEQAPRPPSEEVLRVPPADVASFGTARHVLSRQLRGDLDAIVLKTLEKQPANRYVSVEALATDLRRHLTLQPVTARPATAGYRLGKYARRHRLPLAAASLVLATILIFTAALVRQLEQTRRERDRSQRLSSFLVDLFRAAEPDSAGEDPTVRELVDVGRQRLETELEQEPEARADLLGTLGQVYYRLGHFDAASEAHETSIDVLRERFGDDHPTVARALNDLAAVAFSRGQLEPAEELWRRALAMRQRLGVAADLNKPRNNLASVLLLRGKLDEAEAIYRQSLAERLAIHGERHPNVATTLRNVALTLYLGGELDAAEPLFRQSLDIRLEAYDRETPTVATALASLARLAQARGDLDAAEPLYLEALDTRRRRLGDDHLLVASLEKDFAEVVLEHGDLDTAGVLLDRALRQIYRHRPAGDPMRAELESIYGAYLAARGRLTEAEPCLSGALETLERVRGPGILPTRQARRRLAAFRGSGHPEIRGEREQQG